MGDVEIRSAGVVAIDTASLRAAAGRLEHLSCAFDEVTHLLRQAAEQVEFIPRAEAVGAASRGQSFVGRSVAIASATRDAADRLRLSAAVFETVELRAERAAADAAGDADAVARIDARIDELERDHPTAGFHATWDEWARGATWSREFVSSASGAAAWLGAGVAPVVGVTVWGFLGSTRIAGAGTIPATARLTGPVDPVRIQGYVPAGAAATAPASLAAAAARLPTAAGGRVRVERYTMPDGSRQFAVYVRGTTSAAESDPFDGTSNTQLYSGERSASYEATIAALRDAGAEPGDVVHAFGHSQGAMIASRLALEGGFDTQTLVTFGSPVEADVGEGTLSIAVRHTDDPVAALTAGGYDTTTGAAGSLIAERAYDAPAGPFTADPLAAHHLTAYEETAEILDASADPRLQTVRERLAALGDAASVDVTEYAAYRVSPSSEDGG